MQQIAQKSCKRNKQITFKNCAPFTNCISQMNNTQINNVKDLDDVMPMFNLIEYNNNYGITSGRLRKYDKNDPNDNIRDFESLLVLS